MLSHHTVGAAFAVERGQVPGFLVWLLLLMLFTAAPAWAQSTPSPGGSCSTSGLFAKTNTVTLVCDGSQWDTVETYGASSGLATVVPNIGYDSGSCTSAKEGELSNVSGVLEMCHSGTWIIVNGNTPNPFSFTNATNVPPNTSITSNTVTPTGFNGVVFATCSNCTTILINGNACTIGSPYTCAVSPGSTVAVRMTSSSSVNTMVSTTVTVGAVTTTWQVTTENCTTGNQTFSYTGSAQTFTVPTGCYTFQVNLVGAGGGGGENGSDGSAGGPGGFTMAYFMNVTPGTSFSIVVGQGGPSHSTTATYGGGGGGGSTSTSYGAGAGGGRSAIIYSGTELFTAAGDGGGGGTVNFGDSYTGGQGGGYTGSDGGYGCGAGYGGCADTQSAGGAAGSHGGTAGSALTGGNSGACPSTDVGGGGGGGWYGGSGGGCSSSNGIAQGGGGGSGYTGGGSFSYVTTPTTLAGSGAAGGGVAAAGTNGHVYISYP